MKVIRINSKYFLKYNKGSYIIKTRFKVNNSYNCNHLYKLFLVKDDEELELLFEGIKCQGFKQLI